MVQYPDTTLTDTGTHITIEYFLSGSRKKNTKHIQYENISVREAASDTAGRLGSFVITDKTHNHSHEEFRIDANAVTTTIPFTTAAELAEAVSGLSVSVAGVPAPTILQPVETNLQNVGVVKDANGDVVSKVFIKVVRDENTGAESTVYVKIDEDGTITDPYAGAFEFSDLEIERFGVVARSVFVDAANPLTIPVGNLGYDITALPNTKYGAAITINGTGVQFITGENCIDGKLHSAPQLDPSTDGYRNSFEFVVPAAGTDIGTGTDTELGTFQVVWYEKVAEGVTEAIAAPATPYAGYTGITLALADCGSNDNLEIWPFVDDNAGVLTAFYRGFVHKVVDGAIVTTEVGDYTDRFLTTPYVVQGTATPDDEAGVATKWQANLVEIANGGSWSPSILTRSFAVKVVGSGATYTGSNGSTVPLVDGFSASWGDDNFDLSTAVTLPVIASTGATITITETRIGQ